jgi:hypothetical protein
MNDTGKLKWNWATQKAIGQEGQENSRGDVERVCDSHQEASAAAADSD